MTTQSSILTACLNHLADKSPSVRQSLQSHTSETVCFRIGSLIRLYITITQAGYFSAAAEDGYPAVTFSIPPELVPRLVSGDIAAFHEIIVNGDPVLADLLLCLGKTFQTRIEENLSTVTGDILARRVTLAGQALVRWHLGSVRNLSRALGEFITEEQPVTASRTRFHQLDPELELLQQQVLQLEERVNMLASPLSQIMKNLSRTGQ